MECDAPGRGGDPRGEADQFPADGSGGRFGQDAAGERASGAGQVECDGRQHQPGGVGGELAGRQVRQRGVLQIGVDLLDDRVATVCLISGDGVQGAGGEERVEPVRVEEGSLPVGGVLVQLGDAAHDKPAHDLVGFLLRGECGEGHFGDFRGGHPPACFFVPDRVGVFDRRPRRLIDRLDRAFDVGAR